MSSILGLRTPSKITPEKVITATDACLSNGYAESKFISELLCDEASKHLRIPVSIARVGQIAGPVLQLGLWNPVEWLPSLTLSSIRIRALPDSVGLRTNRVDWIPVDYLAEIIVDLSLHRGRRVIDSHTEVLHLQNPKVTSWTSLMPDVKSILEVATSTNIVIIPARSWLATIRQDFEATSKGTEGESRGGKLTDAEMEILLKVNPAIKLLDFFSSSISEVEDTNILDLEKTLLKSQPSRALESVSGDWMQKLISEWLLFLRQ